MKKLLPFAILVLLLIASPTARPAQESAPQPPHIILIIRHAEKPDATDGPKDPNLSPRGYERAAALAKVLPDHFPKPDFLFATKATTNSNRPVETITPLSKALSEPIDSTFKTADIDALAHELLTSPKYAGKTILIAWHHEKIPDLAQTLGAKNAPPSWDPKTFDRVWQITFDTTTPTFQNLPQKALPGDSEK